LKSWDGWDTLAGLPHAWRDRAVGAFSAGDRVPLTSDTRVKFHKGCIEQTFNQEVFLRIRDPKCSSLFIFDMDLPGPSLHAYNCMKKNLKIGDVLYFDAAFDLGERDLMFRLMSDFKTSLVAKTFWSAALHLVDL